MFNKYKKALVIGAGSGRDIASSVLITEKLRKQGIRVDLGGFLTPWSLHTFDGKLEQPINKLTKDSKKFIPSKEEKFIKYYFEPELIPLNKELNLGINEFYLFSLQYGIDKLKSEITKLVNKNKYDLIIAADIGGDMFSRKKELSKILTPIVDLSCSEVLANIKTSADTYFCLIGAGSDGELNPKQLKSIISDLKKSNALLFEEELNLKNYDLKKFYRLNKEINSRTDSKSNTYRLIKKVLESESKKIIKQTLNKYVTFEDKVFQSKKAIDIDSKIMKKVFWFDTKKVYSSNKLSIKYNNIFEAYKLFNKLGSKDTEIDLAHIPIFKDKSNYNSVFILNPQSYLGEIKRKKIIKKGLDSVKKGIIKKAVILKEDLKKISLSKQISFKKYKKLYIVNKK